MPMNWQTLQLPLAAGLNQRSDDRARQPPYLDVAKDVQFTEVGGLQTRYPFQIQGSAFANSDIRRIYANGDELVVFTQDKLYSWSPERSSWQSMGTYLAVSHDETTISNVSDDQYDCDRAELNGVIAYAWTVSTGTSVGLALRDKTTGSLLYTTSISGHLRPKLVAMDSTILLFAGQSGANALDVYVISPSSGTMFTGASTTVLATTWNSYYDACKVPGSDVAIVVSRHTTTTNYEVRRLNGSGTTLTSATKALACAGPIACAVDPAGAVIQVVRNSAAGTITGDRLTQATLATAASGQALGTAASATVNQVTVAYKTTGTTAAFFVSSGESTSSTATEAAVGTVTTSGTISSLARFRYATGLASRAFSYNGTVYVWTTFAQEAAVSSTLTAQLQNVNFLYDETGTLCGRCLQGIAEGYRPSTGHLPTVALVDGTTQFAWCATQRRKIQLVPPSLVGAPKVKSYAQRAPRDVVFTFDSNDARRVARLGKTLYITGSELCQYDTKRVTEVGFHTYPYRYSAAEQAAGNLVAGTYAYRLSYRNDNAVGERDRSTTTVVETVTIGAGAFGAGPNGTTMASGVPSLYHTHRTASADTTTIEVWRTGVNPTAEAPFYLVSSIDPSVTSNPNRYLTRVYSGELSGAFTDEYADATATIKETHPEDGGILESISPPASKIVIATDTRLFLAGIPGEPNRVMYSKLRSEGEVASFNDALFFDVPTLGGAITGLAFLNETLIVFCETAIYAIPGDGYDNLGNGQNYGPARLLAQSVGAVSQEAIATTSEGVVFKSARGWYMLNRGWSANYIGGPISDYDSDTVLAIHALDSKHEIRCLTDQRVLILDTAANQWAEWTIDDGLHACLWNNTYYYVNAATVRAEQTDYSAVDYGLQIETAWIKLNDLQGAGSVRTIQILGEYRSAHQLRVQIAYDYDSTFVDDKYWTPSPATVGGPLQLRHGPSRQKVEAIKIRLTAVSASSVADPPASDALKLTGLALEVGVKPTMYRRLPAAQRQ